jgi:hypothetical protein
MAVVHTADTRNTLANYIAGRLAGGSLAFLSASNAVVAVLQFDNPAFDAPVSGAVTCRALTSDPSAAISSIVTKAIAYDSNNNEILSCVVSGPGGDGDILLSSVNAFIAETQEVRLDAGQLVYEAAP